MLIVKESAETCTCSDAIILTKFSLLRIRHIFGWAVFCDRLSPGFAALNATDKFAALFVKIGATTASFVLHVAGDPGSRRCPSHVQLWVVLAAQAQFLNIKLRWREWWHSMSRVMLTTSPINGNSNKCDTFVMKLYSIVYKLSHKWTRAML
jgi:hypothetical protein